MHTPAHFIHPSTSQGARRPLALRPAQRGMTLIELLVGIAIGLMVVAVAGVALMTSRGVSGTVSDTSNINQQAAYAMRVIGLQLRQAGSLRLNLNPGEANAVNAAAAPVAFEKSADADGGNDFNLANIAQIISEDADNVLTVGYQRYADPLFVGSGSLARNCIGGPDNSNTDQRVESLFSFIAPDAGTGEKGHLRCGGNDAVPQPLIESVANFQLRYLVQAASGSSLGNPTVEYVNAAAVTNWGQVQAVEVCLVLYGSEAIDLPAGSSYLDCDGSTSVDMTTLTDTQRKNRMHRVFRNVFQLRAQGLLGSVL